MSSFDDFYKKWKENNNISTETTYQNLSNEQKAQNAIKDIDKTFERINNQSDFLTIWNQVQNTANNNINSFNNLNNTKNMLDNNSYSSKKTIWDKLNDFIFGNSSKNKKEYKNVLNNSKSNKEENEQTKETLLEEKFNNKQSTMIFSEQEKQAIPIRERNEVQEKNKSIWQDVADVAGLTGLGVSNGINEMLNYIESTNENNFSNYKKLKERQFLNSQNVSEEDKAIARNQNNLLLQKNGINVNDKIETNLVKKAIRDRINKDEEEIEKRTLRISNKGMEKLGELAPSIGQMIPGTIAGVINPVLGTSYFTTSASGGYINDALNRGMTEEKAWKYGTIMGALEGASDSFITGQQLNKVTKAFTGKQIDKKLLNSYGFNIFENALQESVMEPAQEITAEIIGEKDDWSNVGARMIESGLNGALIGAITNGVTYGLEKSKNVYNKIKNKQEINPKEYKEALQENINKFGRKTVEQNIRQGSLEIYQELNNTIKNQPSLQLQQIEQEHNRVVQNENIEQINNNLVNNQNSLYNNGEREGGINEQIQNRRMAGISGQFNTRLQQNSEHQKVKQYSTEQFKQWEQSIKPIKETDITIEQKSIKNIMKRQYNKDIVFFNGNDNKGYLGGASLNDSNRIYVDTNSVKTFGENKIINHEIMESDIRHNRQLSNEIIQPAIQKIIDDPNFETQKSIFWEGQEDNMPSDYLIAKDILCDRFSEIKTGEKLDYDNVLSQETNMTLDYSLENFHKQLYRRGIIEQDASLPTKEIIRRDTQQTFNVPIDKKTLNPTEISNLTHQDSSTTPNLPTKNYIKGNKKSNFYSNITESSHFLNENLRDEMAKDENIQYYQGITNKETLKKAYTKLQNGGQQETLNWFNKEGKNADATDVAKGWILLKQYQDSGDYQSAVEVAKKMREIGTKAGQTVQAYNILSRLTPEGMFYYAQSELTEAYNKMVEGKSQKWIEENRVKFDLTPDETQFIKDTMQEVSEMEDGYDKKVKIAEIQKILTDKIPSTAGQSIKAWMRISMLFNPKTQVRNVLGNAVILPVNSTGDFISAGVDKLISKKTGVRTTGNMNLKNYGKGFGKGLYESYNDFRKGINTRNIEGNRFEVSEGKSFNDKGIGKALNRVDNILSFMLDAGDRGFYEATFTNSINNQLILNSSTKVTQDMIDIATNEALQRTWQDNNAYTESVLKIRNILNKANMKGYGLGDVIIPFAKTPANLTKAIVDYSPIGLTKAITADAIKFKNSLSNGQYTPQMQHKLVQNIGKGMAGTFLYVLGYGLSKAGIATGESDDDKDVKNFMKNSLGISSYSLKIGDKTFSYDWAQPVATPLAIMTNYFKYSEENSDANIIEKGIKSLNIGTEQLLQQSFMESLNTILNGNGTTLENLSQSILELPARAIPTFSKQIADMVDGTQRTSFEYNQPVQSAMNSIRSKIPGLSKSLPASVDTLGNEIKKYGGENNFFNVLLNPANVNKGQLSKAGEEIYRLYEQIGSTAVFPITAPYYVNSNGEKRIMTSEERSKYQKSSGQYTEKAIKDLLSNEDYKKLSDNKKVELIEDIISDSNAKAKFDILKIESKDSKKKRELIEKVTPKYYYDYLFKTKDIEGEDATKKKNEVILNANYPDSIKSTLYKNTTGKQDDLYNNILSKDNININEYLKYKQQEFESDKKDDGTVGGKSVSGSKKKKVYNYVSNMNITSNQKIAIIGTKYKLNKTEQKELYNYIKNIYGQTAKEKLEIFKKYSSNFTIYQDGTLSLK